MKGAAVLVLLVVVALVVNPVAEGAVTCSPVQLGPCASAITSSRPPSALCCQRVRQQMSCMCGYMKNPTLRKFADNPNARNVANKDGDSSLLSIEEVTDKSGPTLCRSDDFEYASWLIKWSEEFNCAEEMYFLPEDVQSSLRSDRRLLLAFTHFLYHSFSSGYLSITETEKLSSRMPLINNYGQIVARRNGVLVPANGSTWVQLLNSNPWKAEDYVELHEDYLRKGKFDSQHSSKKELVEFLRDNVGTCDVPDIDPPTSALTCVFAPLTKENAFLLLDWIRKIRSKGIALPSEFIKSIREGNWLRVSMSGCIGYRPPCQSFLYSSSWGSLLQNRTVMIDNPMIDQEYYYNKLNEYGEELKAVGVMSTYPEACEFIGNHLMSLAESSCLTKTNVIAMLGLIEFLREKYLSPDKFIANIKEGNWMKTPRGVRSPVRSVLYDDSWKVASEVTDLPFIDEEYYGNCLLEYKTELQLLDVLFLSSSSSIRLRWASLALRILRLQFVSGGLVFSSYLVDRWSSSAVLRLLRLFFVKTSFKIEEEGNCSGEISAQINSNSTPHRNCSGSSGIRRRAEKNLLRICRAFSSVGAAQFPWVKIFREYTLAKITEKRKLEGEENRMQLINLEP
ncbi:hypothetical protein V2J09_016937 [Rumex salicifolius]